MQLILSSRASSLPASAIVSITISDVTFQQGTASNHDLRQYYEPFIPSGEEVIDVQQMAGPTLPTSGVSLDAAGEQLSYDGVGLATTISAVGIRVETDTAQLTTFSLVEP